MDIFHVEGNVYGWLFAWLSTGLIGASQVNSYLLRRYQSEQSVCVALGCQVLTTCALLGLTSAGMLGLGGTSALLFVFLGGLGGTRPHTSALSLAPSRATRAAPPRYWEPLSGAWGRWLRQAWA
jgi:DHA1 family bicyclomycin/chloramphenicol resistance-like MFS transporter